MLYDCAAARVQMVLNNLNAFNTAISTQKALFQVECVLAPPDVIMHPAANEVFKLTFQCVRDCSETYASTRHDTTRKRTHTHTSSTARKVQALELLFESNE